MKLHHHTQPIIHRGFTLIELLVTIAIIVILISILIPTVTKVRTSAYEASTKNEISIISNACYRYHDDFKAFPGPFSNDDVFNPASLTPALVNGVRITMAENLYVGLAGGLSIPQNFGVLPPQNWVFTFGLTDAANVGNGPLSFNPANPKRYPAYMSVTFVAGGYSSHSLDPVTGQPARFVDDAGNSANDSPLPEFVDQFPSPLPILYLRARTGAQGIISSGNTASNPPPSNDANGPPYNYQYDIRQITPYTASSNPLPIGIPQTPTHTHYLSDTGETNAVPLPFYTSSGYSLKDPTGALYNPNGAQFFMSQSIPPTDLSNGAPGFNATGTPRGKDGFILISAGRNRIYGDYNNILNLGDVQQ
jgi:prepilin-type N-terminal cleavage/methylation domain-containing protein